MIKITVVDDDALFGSHVAKLIEECAPEPVATACFQSGRAFLEEGHSLSGHFHAGYERDGTGACLEKEKKASCGHFFDRAFGICLRCF